MQEMAVGGKHADHRAQEFRIAGDQRRRQEAFGDEPVGAVDIGGDALQQFGALNEALRDGLPLDIVDQDRNMGQRPAALRILLGAIGPVEDAGIAQIAVGAGEAVGKLRLVHAADGGEKMLPDRPDIAVRVEHFIGNAGKRAIAENRIVFVPVLRTCRFRRLLL